MAYIYRIPNREVAEAQEIRRLIRASNAESIARRREQDEPERQAQIAHCGRDLRLVAQSGELTTEF